MTNTKMTKKEKFEMLMNIDEVAKNEILVDFINHELELLAKKNSERKPTTSQIGNLEIQKAILDFMEDDEKYTITDLIKNVDKCKELTNQKVSALVRMMIGTSIEKIVDKRKSYFKKIDLPTVE